MTLNTLITKNSAAVYWQSSGCGSKRVATSMSRNHRCSVEQQHYYLTLCRLCESKTSSFRSTVPTQHSESHSFLQGLTHTSQLNIQPLIDLIKKKMFLSLLQLTFTFQITLKGLGRWLRDKDTCCESKFSPQNLQWWRVPQAGLWHVRACIHKLKRNSTKLFSFKGYLFYCVGISNEIQLVQTRLWKYKIHTELKDLNNGNVLERW